MVNFLHQKNRLSTILFIALALVLITINFPKHNINSIALIILGVSWLVSIKDIRKLKSIFKQKTIIAYLFFILIYFIGLLYSNDIARGFKVIKFKIPLVLIPIIFFSIQGYITKNHLKYLKLLFICSTIIYCLITIILIALNIGSVVEGIPSTTLFEKYSHSNLTIKIDNHPTYLSYTIIVCVLLLTDLFRKKEIKVYSLILISCFFFFYTLLLSSKIGIVAFVILSLYLGYKNLKLKHTIILYIGIIVSFILMLSFTDLSRRFKEEYQSIKLSQNLKDKSVPVANKNQRLIAVDIFLNSEPKQYLTGLGTGGVQDYLNKKYRYYLPTQNRSEFKGLNYHNQYFQTMGDVGILGLLFLIYPLFLCLKISFSRKQVLYVSFLIVTISFFLIESFLETQRGIMLYICCNSMFLFLLKK